MRVLIVLVIIVGALLVNTGVRFSIRRLTRRAVKRALQGKGRWTPRAPRLHDGGRGEDRRLQRADAAAHMFARISSLIVAAATVVGITTVLGIDPLVLLSSAGFLGAGLAIGGQTVIKDWLTGLIVLLEDRYAGGDQVTLRVGGNDVSGTVENLNGAGARLRLTDGTTWHAGHGSIESVINHSQQLVANQIEVPAHVWDELDETMVGAALNAASHDLGLTDVVLLSDLRATATASGNAAVTVHATRHLSDRQRLLVADRIQRTTR